MEQPLKTCSSVSIYRHISDRKMKTKQILASWFKIKETDMPEAQFSSFMSCKGSILVWNQSIGTTNQILGTWWCYMAHTLK